MNRRVVAWLNLAYHFALHVLVRTPVRALRRGRESERFLAAVLQEGYAPLTNGERDVFPSFMNCIHCGLCSLACPALREAPASAWSDTWTFVAGPSRSLDRALLIESAPCGNCDACAAVCPTGVPIPLLAALTTRLASVNATASPG